MIVVLTTLSSTPSSHAYYQDYVPANMQSARMLKQKVVALNFDHDWKAEALPGITAANCQGQFSVSGADNQGKAWRIDENEPRDFGGSCYTADVDGNGRQDIVLHFTNGSCGLPFSSLVLIFIDSDGRPHREELISRFSADKNGVADIVVAPTGGLILQQDLAFGKIGNRDCGYWRWSVFKAEHSHLIEQKSAFKVSLPAYVFFTNKPNHLLSTHGAELERKYKMVR